MIKQAWTYGTHQCNKEDKSDIIYLNVVGLPSDKLNILTTYAIYANYYINNMLIVAAPAAKLSAVNVTVTSLAIEPNHIVRGYDEYGTILQNTILESIYMSSINKEEFDAIPRLTREEFYSNQNN